MEYTLLHQTTYRYNEKIHESYSILHLQPRSDARQYCTKFELNVTPRARVFSYIDRFGNDTHHFAVLPDHDVLSIMARSTVMTVPFEPVAPHNVSLRTLMLAPEYRWLYDERHESEYVRFGAGLVDFAAQIGVPGPDDDVARWFFAAGHAIHARFTYDKRATSVQTTVDEAIRFEAGVCQDFAHILIALARYAGLPARYVSGYLFSGQAGSVLGAEASHAWAEAFLPPLGWVGFDPTNDCLIDARFVRIATGRDYRDVSPVRGVYKGASSSTMSVNVAMEALAGAQQ